MKKGLLYLLMFVMGSLAFTACSDDDDPNWKKLPEEVSGENADLKINGVSTGGTIKLDVKNESEAVLNLNNVIPGCETVAMNVEMIEQEDGSFNFRGEQQVEGIEVRSTENTAKNKYDVNVSGNVTVKGQLKADLTIKLIPSSLGSRTYSGATLKLAYSERELVGKQVLFATTDGQTANLTLTGIIPGEPQVAISNVALTVDGFKCNFNGNVTTTAGTQIVYTGMVVGDTLNLSLNATLSAAAQGNLAKAWDILTEVSLNEDCNVAAAPFFLTWEAPTLYPDKGINTAEQVSNMANAIVSNIITEVLHQVNFSKDGNVIAKYHATDLFSQPMDSIMAKLMGDINIPADRIWETSPKNLAFWYTKNNKLYIIPDIPMILKQVGEDGGNVDLGGLDINNLLQGLQNMSGAEIKEYLVKFLTEMQIPLDLSSVNDQTLKEVVGWLATGIPLNYTITDGGLYVYVDQEMVEPFMAILLPMLPALQAELDKLAQQPGNQIMGLLPFILGLNQITELAQVWETTTTFDLGLMFK